MKNIPQEGTKTQPRIETEMGGKGLTVHAGLLPVPNFMGKLFFRSVIGEAVQKERAGATRRFRGRVWKLPFAPGQS